MKNLSEEKVNSDICPRCGDPDYILVVTKGIYHCLACDYKTRRIPETGMDFAGGIDT
jgi:ribosomal protein L37AE/L43A